MENRSFDYIVVGAGSAGCAVANRLSENPATRVLLLEAGGADDHPYLKMPLGFLQALQNPALTWTYKTAPEPYLNNRILPLPRGRVLGGSSSINGMVHFRGHPLDFDEWAALGCDGWAYKDVLPYFKRSENHWSGGNEWRGGDGPINVIKVDATHFLADELKEAARNCGYQATDDYDGAINEGIAPVQVAIESGARCSSARAYLDSVARNRGNLVIEKNALAQKIDFDGKHARRVVYEKNGQTFTADVKGEIILCGGAYNSPQLLMLSGIGPAGDLTALGVPLLHDLKGVGANLQEHVRLPNQFNAELPNSFREQLRFDRAAFSFLNWMFFRRGPFANQIASGMLLVKTDPALDRPDIQIMISPVRVDANIWFPGIRKAMPDCFYSSICLLRPESRGRLTLESADPRAYPRIQLNMLENTNDRKKLLEGMRISRRLFETAPISKYVREEVIPGAQYQTEEDFAGIMPDLGGVVHHPVGTCSMGKEDMSVVDPSLRVHGVDGLRIADASVMPRLVGANTNAASVMIGEKAADMILHQQ